jgi:hypothetical protein
VVALYLRDQAPQQVLDLTAALVPRLLEGGEPQIAALRQQFDVATVESVESDGVGFFVTLGVPDGAPRVEPQSFAGGDADIWLVGHEHPMGVVLFVRHGHLSRLDFYSKSGASWAEGDVVERVDNVLPLPVPID